MAQPSINISFKSTAITAIQRGDKGVVLLILKDTDAAVYEMTDVTDIPEALSADNAAYVQRAFTGYQTAPKKVIAVVVEAETAIADALSTAALYEFDYLCGPPDLQSADAATIASWIKSQRENEHRKYKAVLPNQAADYEGVINFTSTGIQTADDTFTTAEFCSRIAGLIAGTPMTISCTYAPLPEVVDIDRLTKEEADEAEEDGELILLHDGEKVKLGRGVNSFVTTTQEKSKSFRKIKIVECLDMINLDIRSTCEDSYIGKYANSYDNKVLLVTAISGYFDTLEMDGLLESGTSSIDIDVDAQRTYLKSKGTDVTDMTDTEIRMAGTDDQVFLLAHIQPLDAIEDITLNVYI